MKFRIDDNLIAFTKQMREPKEPQIVARELCAEFVKAGMLKEQPELYGEVIFQHLGPQYLSNICEVLSRYLGVQTINFITFNLFGQLIVIGDNDCPYCGGKLEVFYEDDSPILPALCDMKDIILTCSRCGAKIRKDYA